jgi:hypothetical protein
MDMEPAVAFVIDRFNRMLEGDGARLDVVEATADGVTLRYVAGPEGECEACVLDPDDLDVLVADALERQGATPSAVTILR